MDYFLRSPTDKQIRTEKGHFIFMIDAGKFITKGQWPFVFRFVVVFLFKKTPNLRMVWIQLHKWSIFLDILVGRGWFMRVNVSWSKRWAITCCNLHHVGTTVSIKHRVTCASNRRNFPHFKGKIHIKKVFVPYGQSCQTSFNIKSERAGKFTATCHVLILSTLSLLVFEAKVKTKT